MGTEIKNRFKLDDDILGAYLLFCKDGYHFSLSPCHQLPVVAFLTLLTHPRFGSF